MTDRITDRELKLLARASLALRHVDEALPTPSDQQPERLRRMLGYLQDRHGDVIARLAENFVSYEVNLTDIGDKKIQVIKQVRAVTEPTLSLSDAKDLVEARGTVVRGVDRIRAEEVAHQLKDAGATVDVVKMETP